ncbi:MAG TPA: hypothetical protein VMV94_20740 [Phycisphaerae bacterium]|nr:hypothetical protein [Phycisphaerae bacterium]
MSIAVNCRCGKAFKVKDHMAGKAVRCPSCKHPLRIPGEKPSKGAAPPGASKTDKQRAEEAILRFEAAQKKKQRTAEDEAALRAERNKLIESYDQLVGKSGIEKDKNGKHALAGEKKTKATVFTKLRDAVGVVLGNLFVRYIMIMIVISAGVVGSVYLVRFVTTYMGNQTVASSQPKDEQIKDAYKKFEEAMAAKDWTRARDALEDVLRIDPVKVNNREYQAKKKRLEEAVQKS